MAAVATGLRIRVAVVGTQNYRRIRVHGPKSSRGGVVRKKRVFYVVMVHPFLAIQAFLPPVLRTAAEIYFRAAGGRASFLLVPATRQPIAKIYSLCARSGRIFRISVITIAENSVI